MLISKKHQYALRAVYELARNYGNGPVKISKIAGAQAIPERFLEVILGQLKKSGFVDSKRGYEGGYELIVPPCRLTVGALMRYLQKDAGIVECMVSGPESDCPFKGDCAFYPMMKEVKSAIFEVYNKTTIQDLLNSSATNGKCPITGSDLN